MKFVDVSPNNDDREHIPGGSCPCGPDKEQTEDMETPMFVHHAWDGREAVEDAETFLELEHSGGNSAWSVTLYGEGDDAV